MTSLINIGTLFLNNYIISSPAGLVVVDTGYAGGFDVFKQKFERHGFKPGDIRFIFLTHAHDDHAGYLNELLSYTAAPVVLHEAAAGRLRTGQNSFSGGCSTRLALMFCKLMALFGKASHRFPPVDRPDRYRIFMKNEQYLQDAGFDADILHLPGHTPDSIGILMRDGSMICGDAAMNDLPSVAHHTIWIEDIPEYQKSWDEMLLAGSKTIYPGHGRPFPAAELARYRSFMSNRKIYPLAEPQSKTATLQ